MDIVFIHNTLLSLAGSSISIINHPQSHSTYYGMAVTLTVSATGPGTLHYLWKKDGAAIDDSDDNLTFSGVNSPNLFIQSYMPIYEGSYACAISNEVEEVDTSSAELTG